jgi:hypothetical protein
MVRMAGQEGPVLRAVSVVRVEMGGAGGAGGLGGDRPLSGLQKTFMGRLGHGCLAHGTSFLGYLITGSEVRLSSETLRRHHVKARQLYEQCKTRQRQAARVFAGGNTIAGFAPPWLQARAYITSKPQMRNLYMPTFDVVAMRTIFRMGPWRTNQ